MRFCRVHRTHGGILAPPLNRRLRYSQMPREIPGRPDSTNRLGRHLRLAPEATVARRCATTSLPIGLASDAYGTFESEIPDRADTAHRRAPLHSTHGRVHRMESRNWSRNTCVPNVRSTVCHVATMP